MHRIQKCVFILCLHYSILLCKCVYLPTIYTYYMTLLDLFYKCVCVCAVCVSFCEFVVFICLYNLTSFEGLQRCLCSFHTLHTIYLSKVLLPSTLVPSGQVKHHLLTIQVVSSSDWWLGNRQRVNEGPCWVICFPACRAKCCLRVVMNIKRRFQVSFTSNASLFRYMSVYNGKIRIKMRTKENIW